MIVGENIFVMLMMEPFFRTFTKKRICDPHLETEVLITLACDSRAHVDALVAKAIEAGGSTPSGPEDLGFMYQHEFQDLDGHGWGLMFMDPAAAGHG